MFNTVKLYYSLTKPGVLFGNVITSAAGFFLASKGHIDLWLLISVFIGTSLVIASACVLNNYLDQDIDRIMDRTKKRAVADGAIDGYKAVIFSAVLGVSGAAILYLYTNYLVLILGLIGYITYVVLYGMLSKRLSYYGTLVGSVSGAIPILSGYCAVTGRIDAAATLLFIILFLWQLPEFYSIAVYRMSEYKAANIPVISVVKGIKQTKIHIFVATVGFVVSTVMLTILGYTGYIYLGVMGALGLYWIKLGFSGLKTKENDQWARGMFKFSLIMLLTFSFMVSIDYFLI
ncbi:MAG: heme o synthase [Candidatus Saccharimonadales bacterium]